MTVGESSKLEQERGKSWGDGAGEAKQSKTLWEFEFIPVI